MEIATLEKNRIDCSQLCERGIAARLILFQSRLFKRVRLAAGRYVVLTLCAIAIGLGGCTATATAPDAQSAPDAHRATAIKSDAQYVCPAGPGECKVEPAAESGRSEARRCGAEGQPPCQCLTDYFFSTDRPFCTAVDWLVVMPVVVGVVLFVAGGSRRRRQLVIEVSKDAV
jgi:hypothetical protein